MEDRAQKKLVPFDVQDSLDIADEMSAFIELPGNAGNTYTYIRQDGNIGFSACGNQTLNYNDKYTRVGENFTVGVLDTDLKMIEEEKITWTKNPKAYGDERLSLLGMDEMGFGISNDGNFGACKIVSGNMFAGARLYPSSAQHESWWYAENWFYPEYAGLLYLDADTCTAYLGVRVCYTHENPANNSLLKFSYHMLPSGEADYRFAENAIVRNVDASGLGRFWMHRSQDKILHVITEEKEYKTYDADLELISTRNLNPEINLPLGFCVYNNVLVLLYGVGYNLQVEFRTMDANQTLIKTVAVNDFYRKNSSFNTRIFYWRNAFFIQNGFRLFKIPASF